MSLHRDDEFAGKPDLIKKRARFLFIRDSIAFITALLVSVSLILLVANAFIGFKTRSTLLDCTQPTGKCAQEGQKKTAIILHKIFQDGIDREVITRKVIVTAVACAKIPENNTTKEVQACVDRELKNGTKRR